MDRKTQRLLLCIAACSATGIVLGAIASIAGNQQCLVSATPADSCFTKAPSIRIIEGMSGGLVAGAGAAFGATWQIWDKD